VRKACLSFAIVFGVSLLATACGSSANQTLTPTAPSTTATAVSTTAPVAAVSTTPAQTPAAVQDVLFGCELVDHYGFVLCIHDHINPTDPASVFEVTKRVAWGLRAEGAGLLIKSDGENVISWQGYDFSAGRICFPDGSVMKVITDVGVGGQDAASWTDNGFVDPSRYVPAIDPAK
jgi:hypothetical protein